MYEYLFVCNKKSSYITSLSLIYPNEENWWSRERKKNIKEQQKIVKRPFLPPSLDMCDTTHMQKMSLFYYICILPYQLFNEWPTFVLNEVVLPWLLFNFRWWFCDGQSKEKKRKERKKERKKNARVEWVCVWDIKREREGENEKLLYFTCDGCCVLLGRILL